MSQNSRSSRNLKILIVFMTMCELRFAEPSSIANPWQLDQRQHRSLERRPLNGYHGSIPLEPLFLPLPDENDYGMGIENNVVDPPTNVAKRVALDGEASSRMLSISGSSCSCESRYNIKDLGENHYPRYLTESQCKPRTCQSRFHSCRLLHYTVHVLKKREANESVPEYAEFPETPLPESLRSKWQLKPMSVAVACLSSSTNRRN